MNRNGADRSLVAGRKWSLGWAVTGIYFAVLGASFAVVSAPALNPVEGDSLSKFTLTMTCSTPGTTIYYTLNGADPTQFDLKYIAGTPITIDRNFTVKAKAWTTTEQSPTTTAVYTLTGDIAAGTSHSLALKSPGGVWAWGLKTDGRLGNNQTSGIATVPLESKYLSTALVIGDAQMVAAGKSHSVVLKSGGTVWSYGLNTTTGALGDNTTVSKAMAVQVRTSTSLFLTSCVAVAAGDGYGGALRSNGGVYTWGDRTLGRLGNSTTITGNSVVAVPVNRTDTGAALGGINRIAFAAASGMAKEASAYEQSGQLGQVWVWGANTSGQLGQGNTTNFPRATRVKLSASVFLQDALEISCAEAHSVVIRWKTGDPSLQGRVLCFGQRQNGRLGNLPIGTTQATLDGALAVTYPVQVIKGDGLPLDQISSVAAGSSHTLALDLSGNVWAWGENGFGALGDNLTTDRGYAMKVKNPAGTGDLQNIVRIAAGGTGVNTFSMAVAADGTVYTWGYNGTGQLGNATFSTTAINKLPVAVTGGFDLLPNPPDVTLAAAVTQSGYPGAVTLTASPMDPDNNITKVEFYCQGVLAGQVTAAPWKINLNNLATGSYQTYAVVTDATGLMGYSPSALFTILLPPPVVTLTSTVTAASVPGAVTLTAVPSDPNGNSITSVDFYCQGSLVGHLTSAPWNLNLTSLVAGSYQVYATTTNSVNQVGTSASAYFTITASPAGSTLDADGDGLAVSQENALGTSDQDPDTDGDGIPDNIDGSPRIANRLDFTASSLLVTSPLR